MNKFEDNLNIILEDLQNYKRDKDQLLPYYIQLRLNKSLSTYYKEVNSSINYIKCKSNNINVVKQLI